MLVYIQLMALAAVQGLTEFLPVSSSGHLVLAQHLLGIAEGDVFLDVLLHVGTLGSVVVVYRREILRLLRFDLPALHYWLCLFVGTLPAVVVGLLFKHQVEALFNSPLFVACALVVIGGVLISTRFADRGDAVTTTWEPRPIPLRKALLVGVAQAVAIAPGASRSGSTIALSLWLGLPRDEAARFSFLLSLPAICGALVLQLASGEAAARADWLPALVAALVAFLVGLAAIRWTKLAVIRDHFWKFGFYCLALGVTVLLVVA